MTQAEESLVVLCNTPDHEYAEIIARTLVERRLAACVNILPPSRSVYRWQGHIEEGEEYPILIKTTRSAYPEMQQCLREQHPYDVPEIIALSVEDGLPEYLDWIGENVRS